MAPDADSEEMERLNAPVYQTGGHRVLPEETTLAQAWAENEERSGGGSTTNSPGEHRRLLNPPDVIPSTHKSRLQSGLTLKVSNVSKKHIKYPLTTNVKHRQKTKFEKRKEKLVSILKPPYFILSMIVFIVCLHVWLPEEARAQLEWSPGAWWREPWRLLTYGFVHASAAHLALNAVVALAVGWRLEREQGRWRAAGVWAGGVAAGALGAGALQPRVRVVGASAAVYALLTAHLPNVCLRFGHIPLWWFRPLSVVVLGASEGCWALVRGAGAGGADQVAWSAHALGALVGIPLAFLVFKGENDSKTVIKASRVMSLAILVGGLVAAALHFTLWYDPDS